MNYAEAASFLSGGRNASSRPIANNTRVERIDDETIGIKLHDTYVVKIRDDGSWQLFTGGWYTVTTKDRINGYAPVRVASDRGRWYVYSHDWKDRVPFFDGIAVTASGTVLNPPQNTLHEERERKRIERDLAAYIKGFVAELKAGTLDLPGNGDCWMCLGLMPGDSNDHLLSHISKDERYFVPSLLFNAVKERGYGSWQAVLWSRLDQAAYEAGKLKLRDRWSASDLARDLRRYLKKRLLPGGGVTPIGAGIQTGAGSGYYGV